MLRNCFFVCCRSLGRPKKKQQNNRKPIQSAASENRSSYTIDELCACLFVCSCAWTFVQVLWATAYSFAGRDENHSTVPIHTHTHTHSKHEHYYYRPSSSFTTIIISQSPSTFHSQERKMKLSFISLFRPFFLSVSLIEWNSIVRNRAAQQPHTKKYY